MSGQPNNHTRTWTEVVSGVGAHPDRRYEFEQELMDKNIVSSAVGSTTEPKLIDGAEAKEEIISVDGPSRDAALNPAQKSVSRSE